MMQFKAIQYSQTIIVIINIATLIIVLSFLSIILTKYYSLMLAQVNSPEQVNFPILPRAFPSIIMNMIGIARRKVLTDKYIQNWIEHLQLTLLTTTTVAVELELKTKVKARGKVKEKVKSPREPIMMKLEVKAEDVNPLTLYLTKIKTTVKIRV